MEEAAMLQELKDRGYAWKGYGDKGSWNGSKETVEAWEDSAFRARIKKNVIGLSFFDTTGTRSKRPTPSSTGASACALSGLAAKNMAESTRHAMSAICCARKESDRGSCTRAGMYILL